MDTIFYTPRAFRDTTAPSLIETLKTDSRVVWVNLEQPTETDLTKLSDVFGFHPLALEDTITQDQRPKAEEYPDHLFIVLKPMTVDTDDYKFREMEVFVGRNYLVTVHSDGEPVIQQTQKRLDIHQERGSFSSTATQILYTLLDVVVDDYRQGLDQLEDEIENLTAQILIQPTQNIVNRMFELRAIFNNMARMILPQRDILNALAHHDLVFIRQDSQYYLRDVSDHLNQVIDQVRLGQDNLNALMNLYASSVSNQLNQHVNRLTVFATIIGVFAVFTGFFGMNFEQTWPGWSEPLAIPMVLVMILVTVGLFLAFLRWRRWY
jgi:magnesium transporter